MLDKKHRFPKELSGGEQQRVSIARAVVKNPKLLLCDEPTGALDFITSRDILKLLQKINQEYKTTILMITHNSAISAMAHRVYRVKFLKDPTADSNQTIEEPAATFKKAVMGEGITIVSWMNANVNPRISFVTAKQSGIAQVSTVLPVAILILTCILTGIIMWRTVKRESLPDRLVGNLCRNLYDD